MTLSVAAEFTPSARLRIEQPAKIAGKGTYHTVRQFQTERGALVIPLQRTTTAIQLTAK